MKLLRANWGISISLIGAALFALFFPFVADPVHSDYRLALPDNREHRLESLSHEQTTALQNRLKEKSKSNISSERAWAIGQLVTTYRKRAMIKESLHWLKKGLAAFPNDPHLKREEKEMIRIIKRNQ